MKNKRISVLSLVLFNGFANRAYGKLKPFLDGPLSRIVILASYIVIAILKDFRTTDVIVNLDPRL